MKKALFILAALTLALASQAAWANDLLDIKLEELSRPLAPKWGIDPFTRYEDRFKKPVPKVQKLRPKFSLAGIITDDEKALAIINKEFYRQGDRVGDYMIEKIGKNEVWLNNGTERLRLDMRGFAVMAPKPRGKQQ